MKKFALAAIAAAALAGGAAHAYTVGTFSNGLVVPNVIHNGATDTTAVGLINRTARTVPVFWTFFNQNSGHEMDGCFTMTANEYRGLTWANLSTGSFAGTRGYLTFAVGATEGAAAAACNAAGVTIAADGALAGNAFQVSVADRDVAVVPVIDGPLNIQPEAHDLARLDATSLQGVGGARAIPVGSDDTSVEILARYSVDATTSTRITVWSTGSHRGTHTVDIYNNAQQRTSGNFNLREDELSWFNPGDAAQMPSKPTSYTDGFIVWNPSKVAATGGAGANSLATLGGSVFVYSTITSSSFGAAQTLLGAHN